MHRRMVPEHQPEFDGDDPLPVEAAAHQARRQAFAALISSKPVWNAVKQVAEEISMSFYVPLPTKTTEQKLQYADFKMVSDAIELMLQAIQQEGNQGLVELSGQEDVAPLPPDYYERYPYTPDQEDDSRWTTLKTN